MLSQVREKRSLVKVKDHVDHETVSADRLCDRGSDWNKINDSDFIQFVFETLKDEHELDEIVGFFSP